LRILAYSPASLAPSSCATNPHYCLLLSPAQPRRTRGEAEPPTSQPAATYYAAVRYKTRIYGSTLVPGCGRQGKAAGSLQDARMTVVFSVEMLFPLIVTAPYPGTYGTDRRRSLSNNYKLELPLVVAVVVREAQRRNAPPLHTVLLVEN
jgi:hypothetical protein